MTTLLAASWWAPLLQTAIGALAAIGGGAFASAFSSWFSWQKERQALAAALAGEVQGFIDVLDWVQARELIPKGYVFPIEERPFPVFEASPGKIGFLPADLALEVSGFYSHARGIYQSLRTLETQKLDVQKYRETVVEGIDHLKRKAEALVPELRNEAARTWQDYLQPLPGKGA